MAKERECALCVGMAADESVNVPRAAMGAVENASALTGGAGSVGAPPPARARHAAHTVSWAVIAGASAAVSAEVDALEDSADNTTACAGASPR